MSHIPDLRNNRPVAAWLMILVGVATLTIVWSVRETPMAEPVPVILPTGT